MRSKRIEIWNPKEYTYPRAFGFIPNLMSYLHELGEGRPAVIIAPGGGYRMVSPSEGSIVAESFYNKGYQSFVLTYTVNPLEDTPLGQQPLKDLSRAVRHVRRYAQEFGVDPNKIAVCGFSAAGHLCASLCVHYEDVPEEDSEYRRVSNRPDAAILSYPVITAGEYQHAGSFNALLGENAGPAEREYYSLEKQVKKSTPPCFLWHTAADAAVPVENSLLFAAGCRRQQVSFALHVFSEGNHGLSLSNEIWRERAYEELYPLEQLTTLLAAAKAGKVEADARRLEELEEEFGLDGSRYGTRHERIPNAEASKWVDLATDWLKKMLK